MIQLSIIIVNYKTPLLLDKCIASIMQSQIINNYEIIIIDNHSEDGSEDSICLKYPTVKWINMGYNSGFARANNVGIKNANGKYILLLNPDTEIINNAIKNSLDYYIENEKKLNLGLLGCKLINPDMSVQFSSSTKFVSIKKQFYENDLYCFINRNVGYSVEEINPNTHQTNWIGGAFILFNSNICRLNNIFFDEDFFMYYEDTEWCYRILKKQYSIWYYADAQVLHLGGASAISTKNKQSQLILSEWLFILKIKGKLYLLLTFLIEFINCMTGVFFRNKKGSEYKQYIDLKRDLLKKYFFKIIFNYSSTISSNKHPLIFYEKNC